MKKTLLSIAVGLLVSTSVLADNHKASEIEQIAKQAINKIETQKAIALEELKAKNNSEVEATMPAAMRDLPSAEVFQARVDENTGLVKYGIKVNRSVVDMGFGDFYEITLGGKDNALLHIDQEYVVVGNIIKFENGTHKNISQEYQSELQLKNAENEVAKLSEDNLVTYEAKTEESIGTLYVYTDTTCGYCRKLHQEIETLTDAGVTVSYIAYPRSGGDNQVPVSRDAEGNLVYGKNQGLEDLAQVFCAEDQQLAMTEIKAGTAGDKYDNVSYKENQKSCKDKVRAGYSSGQNIGFGGTPFLYLDNGKVIPGYQPAEAIVKMFKESK
jgi:thiol:disulfide interchange protein DsbC